MLFTDQQYITHRHQGPDYFQSCHFNNKCLKNHGTLCLVLRCIHCPVSINLYVTCQYETSSGTQCQMPVGKYTAIIYQIKALEWKTVKALYATDLVVAETEILEVLAA